MTNKIPPQTIVENEDPALTKGGENIYPQNFQDVPPLTGSSNVNVTVNCINQNITNTFNYPYGQQYEVQFKNGNKFDGNNGLTYNPTSQTLNSQNLNVSGISCLGTESCLRIDGGDPGYVLTKLNNTGSVVWCNPSGFIANPLCVGTVNTSNTYTNCMSGVQKLGFDTDSGFEVTDIGSGIAKIGMNSTFKCWEVNGSSGLIACGLDTVNFIAGSGVTITSDNTAIPKSLTISSTGGGGTPGGSNCQFQYNNSGSFAGACGLTYENSTSSVGLSKICVPSSNDLQISLSSSPTAQNAWYSLYGDGSSSFNDDYGSQIVYDNEGNIIIIGASDDTGSPFLVKYSNSGGVIWKKKFTEINNYYKTGDAVAVDNNNDIYCVIGTSDVIEDSTIFKISSAGSIIWQTTFTDADTTIAGTDLILDLSGNIYICFYLSSSIGVVKLNNSGVVQWQKQFNSSNIIYPQGISLDASGNVLVVGRIDDGLGKFSILILKINSSGTLIWQNQYSATDPTSNQIYAGQITTDSASNIYVTGSFQTPGSFSDTGFVFKIDSSGMLIWQTNISPPVLNPSTYYSGIVLDSNNDIYISGYGNPGGDANDLLITKLNNLGNIVWQRKFSGAENDYTYYFWAVKTIDVYNTSYAVTGYTYSPNGLGAEVVTLQFPTDGTLTGTYGDFQYAVTTSTTDNNLFASAIGTTNEVPSTSSTASGAYNIEDDVNNSNLYIVSLVSNIVTINTQGQLSLSQTDIPLSLSTGATERIRVDNNGIYLNESFKISNSNSNLVIGSCNITLSGQNNIAIGQYANYCMTKCYACADNIAIGNFAAYCNSYGVNNIVVGTYAMQNGYGSYNTAIGHCSLRNNKNGYSNTAIGNFALEANVSGSGNFAIGDSSLRYLIDGTTNLSLGGGALGNLTTGSSNVAIGGGAMFQARTGNDNIAIGTGPIGNQQSPGNLNIAIGNCALSSFFVQPYCGNIAIGHFAGTNGLGDGNTLIGNYGASDTSNTLTSTLIISTGCNSSSACRRIRMDNTGVYLNTWPYNKECGCNNVAIGCMSLYGNTTGTDNIVIGYCSLAKNRIGSHNIALGSLSLFNSCGSGNIALGSNTLYCNTSGFNNIALSCNALNLNTCGYNNIAIGQNALANNTTGNFSVAIGQNAGLLNRSATITAIGEATLRNNTTGFNNVAVGSNAVCANTTGSSNTGVGVNALASNTIGCRNVALGNQAYAWGTTGSYNVAIGSFALWCNSGYGNTVMGDSAASVSITGSYNTVVGNVALSAGNTGNTAIGYAAANQSLGSFNIAVGCRAMFNTTTSGACNNIAIGSSSLNNVAGICNSALGDLAGSGLFAGNNNTFLGAGAQPPTATSCNTITLGNSSITCIRAQVTTISALSDQRDKTNIQDLPLGLEFIMDLRPVKFTWNMRDGGKVGIDDTGFIAQEVLSVEDKYDVGNYLDMVGRENPDKLEVKPGKLIPILVKAVQELGEEVLKLRAEINILKDNK